MRWRASELVMQIGFRHSPSFWPEHEERVGWPGTGLQFLEHQFSFEHPEESDYDTTADVFSALSNLFWHGNMDFTKSILSGMTASLQVAKPARLRPQIITFIGKFLWQVFHVGAEVMSEQEKRILLSAILSEADIENEKYYRMDMLEYAIRSDVWRRYLGLEHLEVLESLVLSIGCVDVIGDTELISALAEENLLDGAILKTWLQVIWLELYIVFPDSEMEQQAESAIKDLFIRRPDLMDDFQMAIHSLAQHQYCRDRSDKEIQRAKDKLEEVCKDVTSTLHAPSTSLI
jgi:hypothetical protein